MAERMTVRERALQVCCECDHAWIVCRECVETAFAAAERDAEQRVLDNVCRWLPALEKTIRRRWEQEQKQR